MIEQWILVH